MLEILQISENGLKANQEWINSISHNVANMQTPGYKKTSVNFGELVNTTVPADRNVQAPAFDGMGVAVTGTMIDASKGDIKSTGRSLDIAIESKGFVELQLEDGTLAYTRLGRLSVNPEGKLTTHDGVALSSDIFVPSGAKNIKIDTNGVVSAQMNQEDFVEVGAINIVQFNNPEYLQPIGNEKYLMTKLSGEAEAQPGNDAGNGIIQGFLEMSNVDLIDEMSNLLMAQRAYQLNARLIQTADQILETVNNLRR